MDGTGQTHQRSRTPIIAGWQMARVDSQARAGGRRRTLGRRQGRQMARAAEAIGDLAVRQIRRESEAAGRLYCGRSSPRPCCPFSSSPPRSRAISKGRQSSPTAGPSKAPSRSTPRRPSRAAVLCSCRVRSKAIDSPCSATGPKFAVVPGPVGDPPGVQVRPAFAGRLVQRRRHPGMPRRGRQGRRAHHPCRLVRQARLAGR